MTGAENSKYLLFVQKQLPYRLPVEIVSFAAPPAQPPVDLAVPDYLQKPENGLPQQCWTDVGKSSSHNALYGLHQANPASG